MPITMEDIKLVGSLAGLATAAFTIWDRLLRGRPLADFDVDGRKTNARFYLRIKNPSDVTILVRGVHCRGAEISRDHSLDAIVDSGMGEVASVILAPGAQHRFVVLKRGTEPNAASQFRFGSHGAARPAHGYHCLRCIAGLQPEISGAWKQA
jgi:hypothetical protein